MAQNHTRKNNIKLVVYFAFIAVSFYVIAHLNIFPGAVSYEETSEGVNITEGTLEKTTATLDVEEYETSDWLRLSLLQSHIRTLQSFLALFSILIPTSLFFIIESPNLAFLKERKMLKILSVILVFFMLFLVLTLGYADVLERIETSLKSIISEN